jgi:hypothetical protein
MTWRSITIIAIALLSIGSAHADTRASVGELSVASGSQLGLGTSLYVRIDYDSDEVVRLWARPFLEGREVSQAMSHGSGLLSGTGHALGWFALTEPGAIDEIRIRAGGGSPYREWIVADLPVSYAWSAESTAQSAKPAWVEDLLREASEHSRQRARQEERESVDTSDVAWINGFALVIVALALGSIALPVRSMIRWHGGWRLAAAVPLGLMIFVILRIIIDTTRDPSSHNLWPFEILMFGACAVAIIGALSLARKILGVTRRDAIDARSAGQHSQP